jgi:hypothetical protein
MLYQSVPIPSAICRCLETAPLYFEFCGQLVHKLNHVAHGASISDSDT